FRFRFSVVDYRALEADHSAFSAIAGYQSSQVTVADGGVTERVLAKDVTGSYFSLLGQKPVAGRLIGVDDEARGDRVAVLTNAYWMRHFGGQPVVGRTLTVNGQSTTIIGVLEQTGGPLERDVALFTAEHWPTPKRKGPFFTMALARLAPGVSPAAAKEALHA